MSSCTTILELQGGGGKEEAERATVSRQPTEIEFGKGDSDLESSNSSRLSLKIGALLYWFKYAFLLLSWSNWAQVLFRS